MLISIFFLGFLVIIYVLIQRVHLFIKLKTDFRYQNQSNDDNNRNEEYFQVVNALLWSINFSTNINYKISINQSSLMIKQKLNNIRWYLPFDLIYKTEIIFWPLYNGTIIWHKKSNIPSPFFINRMFSQINNFENNFHE